ncbi:unnamed protein product [Pleuronectes platessa]|uniref:Uncharacterized protein n=1 Tax=Pleuronectes platessa TaxID=8262 RepID=A0A9N7YA05_PLEPL|nr:unnamed protein product [Pleuronectes platessa]
MKKQTLQPRTCGDQRRNAATREHNTPPVEMVEDPVLIPPWIRFSSRYLTRLLRIAVWRSAGAGSLSGTAHEPPVIKCHQAHAAPAESSSPAGWMNGCWRFHNDCDNSNYCAADQRWFHKLYTCAQTPGFISSLQVMGTSCATA